MMMQNGGGMSKMLETNGKTNNQINKNEMHTKIRLQNQRSREIK